jgi:hypothetical protein
MFTGKHEVTAGLIPKPIDKIQYEREQDAEND